MHQEVSLQHRQWRLSMTRGLPLTCLAHREGCTAGEFEGLVQVCRMLLKHVSTDTTLWALRDSAVSLTLQRNMAANCGLDYRAAAEFVGCIVLRELARVGEEESCSSCVDAEGCASPMFNLQRALPVLEGLYAGLCTRPSNSVQPGAGASADCGEEGGRWYGRPDEVAAADLLTCGDDARFLYLLEGLVHRAQAAVSGGDTVTSVS